MMLGQVMTENALNIRTMRQLVMRSTRLVLHIATQDRKYKFPLSNANNDPLAIVAGSYAGSVAEMAESEKTISIAQQNTEQKWTTIDRSNWRWC